MWISQRIGRAVSRRLTLAWALASALPLVVPVLGAGLVFAPRADAAPLLSYRTEVAATGWYRPVHIADVDQDGRPDILIGKWGSNLLEIWRYDLVQHRAVLWQSISVPYSIHGISSGDMDEDGDFDIVLAIRSYGVYLCRNNGGTWTLIRLDSRYAWNVQVADIDNDGHLDIFGALDGAGAVLLYGNGTGAFVSGSVPSFVWPASVNVADFDGDGRLDLIGADLLSGYLRAYRNLGGRTWSANLGPNDYHPFLVSEMTPNALDLFGTGNLSPVAIHFAATGYTLPMTLIVYEGMGAPFNPAWSPRVLDVLAAGGMPAGAADLNDDGRPDVFVGGGVNFTGFRAYLNDGIGGFPVEAIPSDRGVGARNGFAVVDFDGDGASDIVAALQNLGTWEPSYGFAIFYRIPDRDAPTASPTQAPAANSFGWNSLDVTVTWHWSDSGSGIDTAHCTTTSTSAGEGHPLTLQATCKDLAGNTGTASYDLDIDKTSPQVGLVGGPANGAIYYFGAVPQAPVCSANDALSGLDGTCTISGYSTALGDHTISASAHDKAGNTGSASATYSVRGWTALGFYQPIDMGGVWNVVKGGATVPLKFELFAGPTELTDPALVVQPIVAREAACSGGAFDDVEVVGAGGTELRYDATAGQFIYNWKTPKKAGYCYVLTISFADGGSLTTNVKLR